MQFGDGLVRLVDTNYPSFVFLLFVFFLNIKIFVVLLKQREHDQNKISIG